MMMRFIFLIALAAVLSAPAHAQGAACEARSLQARSVVVCSIDLTRQNIRLLWQDARGEPIGSLRGIAAAAPSNAGVMLFAMNAGMYHRDLSPVGLYVEDGKEFKALNTAGGPGNFHMRPNGVFFVSGSTAGVLESRAFKARRLKVDFATQSGPMLVIGGRLHPRFSGEGTSRKIRNGVGVTGRMAHFVITDEAVTFTEFARMFRDDLKTPNALYLDGSISSLYAPSVNRADGFLPIGPIVAGFARK